ncbi:MAG: acyl-CoA thioesterase, partial [Gemmatimonadota bacterium]
MEETADARLPGVPVTVEIPVQWGEMDAYDHVNNVVFFRYFESARVRYLERCGFTASYREDRVGAILHSTSCRFRRPLVYPDRVTVGARVTEMEADRFTMEYHVYSHDQDAV